jgi:cell division protein FtsL
MTDTNTEENKNKTPAKMARLAWPKAKYGVVLAVILVVAINLIYYKETIFSFFK